MHVTFTDGTSADFESREVVLIPLISECHFNPDIEEHWRGETALEACYPGNTIFYEGRFRTIESYRHPRKRHVSRPKPKRRDAC